MLWPNPVAPHTATAQEILQRLEQRVREQLRAADAAPPARGFGPPGAAEATGHPAGAPAAYLGVLADDREDRGRGVRVLDVRAGGPAGLGGLQKGDLIVGVGDVPVRQMAELAAILEACSPGDALEFVVERDRLQRRLRVTLTAAPAGESAQAGGAAASPPPPSAVPGPALPGGAFAGRDADTRPPVAPPAVDASDSRIERLENRLGLLEQRIGALEQALLEVLKKQSPSE